MAKKQKYSNSEFERDAKVIAAWAVEQNITNIYGPPRGGLTLAVRLSYLMDKPLILDSKDISNSTLVVDDIVHKGGTLNRLLSSLSVKPHTAALFLNLASPYEPDFFVHQTITWIQFYWETEETSRYDGTV